MAHWTDYVTRGLLAFLSFNHFGSGFRNLLDPNFFAEKMFRDHQGDPLQRLLAVFEILSGLIFMQSAVYLYVYPVHRIMWATIVAYIGFFVFEHFLFESIPLSNGLWFQLLCHAITLLWCAYFSWFKPYQKWSQDVETESLLKHGLPFPKIGRRKMKGK